MRELVARVNVGKPDRPELEQPNYPDDGIFIIDPWAFNVRYEGREVRLTRKETRLLEELARNEGRVVITARVHARPGLGSAELSRFADTGCTHQETAHKARQP